MGASASKPRVLGTQVKGKVGVPRAPLVRGPGPSGRVPAASADAASADAASAVPADTAASADTGPAAAPPSLAIPAVAIPKAHFTIDPSAPAYRLAANRQSHLQEIANEDAAPSRAFLPVADLGAFIRARGSDAAAEFASTLGVSASVLKHIPTGLSIASTEYRDLAATPQPEVEDSPGAALHVDRARLEAESSDVLAWQREKKRRLQLYNLRMNPELFRD